MLPYQIKGPRAKLDTAFKLIEEVLLLFVLLNDMQDGKALSRVRKKRRASVSWGSDKQMLNQASHLYYTL